MKNWEKYEEDIKKILANNGVAFGFIDGKIRECCEILACERCKFIVNNQCNYNRFIWLYEEAKPTLTKNERAFCEIFDNDSRGQTYITRDAGGRLELWADEPINCDGYWSEADAGIRLDPSYFSFISYKDEKAWSIADLLELEVE